MRIDADEQRAVDALAAPVFGDGLSHAQHVPLIERALQGTAPMTGGPECDALFSNGRIGAQLVVRPHQAADINERIGWCWLAGERTDCPAHGCPHSRAFIGCSDIPESSSQEALRAGGGRSRRTARVSR